MRDESAWLAAQFVFSERHGMALPSLAEEWEELPLERRLAVLSRWETIRGGIPDHIKRFEERIKELQERLNEEEDFALSCRLNADIADLASRINDLNIWFRTQQELGTEPEAKAKRHSG